MSTTEVFAARRNYLQVGAGVVVVVGTVVVVVVTVVVVGSSVVVVVVGIVVVVVVTVVVVGSSVVVGGSVGTSVGIGLHLYTTFMINFSLPGQGSDSALTLGLNAHFFMLHFCLTMFVTSLEQLMLSLAGGQVAPS